MLEISKPLAMISVVSIHEDYPLEGEAIGTQSIILRFVRVNYSKLIFKILFYAIMKHDFLLFTK
jgi:hypothetical protein